MSESDDYKPGTYEILSHIKGCPPLGVNHTLPAFQFVQINAPVHHWKFKQVGKHKYLLSIGGYPYTGVLDGKVIASINPEHEEVWEITHQEHHLAFTIALAKKPELGWTVSTDVGEEGVKIQPIIATASLPPQFLPTQVFSIKKHDLLAE